MRSASTSSSSPRRTRCNAMPGAPRSPAAPASVTWSSPTGSPATATWPTPSSKWAFASLRRSAWAREFYDAQRARGKSHHAALRALGNRWLEVLWHCVTEPRPLRREVHVANRKRYLQAAA